MVWCFGNIFRFIDELTAFNACDEFEGSCNEIYPSKLELKKENIGYLERSSLDPMITIKDEKYKVVW